MRILLGKSSLRSIGTQIKYIRVPNEIFFKTFKNIVTLLYSVDKLDTKKKRSFKKVEKGKKR